MPRTNAAHKLQGHQDDEQSGGKDMQQRQELVGRKTRVENCPCGKSWMVRRREKHIGAPHGRGKADGDEKKGYGPDQADGAFRPWEGC
jgi:hypothetical protein